MIPLSERITLELRHRNPAEVTELNLDTSKSDKIEGITDEYVNLRELSLVNVGLKSLAGFPKLPNLEKLDLSDNCITGGLECLRFCPKLNQLWLTSNRIRTIEDLSPLRELPNLEVLDLINCKVSEIEDYYYEVFHLVPQLHFLDGYDRDQPIESDYDEYDDEEVDEHNEDFPVSHAKFSQASGKNGKIRSLQNFQDDHEDADDDDDDDGDDDSLALDEFYGDVIDDSGERPQFDTYNSNYVDENTDDDDDEDSYPPPRGSKFIPNPTQLIVRCATKRSYSSNDEYESARKIFINDNLGFDPAHD